MQDDLLIVGGSFSGLRCASVAAQAGLKVRLIERKPSAGSRPHTTGILVKEAASLLDMPARLTHRLEGVRLYSPALRHIDLLSPGYYFLATNTPAMLDWLVDEARHAGATCHFSTRVDSLEQTQARVTLNRGQFAGRYLVGADGARSTVAQLCGLEQNRQFLFGVEVGFQGIRGLEPNLMHVFIEPKLAPGYIAWVLPGVGITQVGLAVRHPRKPQLDRFISKLGKLFDMSQARQLEYRAGLIPCGGSLSRIATPRICLLGDAAGTVSPLTAGGIYPALSTAEQAASAIADYLQGEGEEPAARIRQAMPTYRTKKLLRLAYDVMPGGSALIETAFASPFFSMLAQTLFYHHRGLLSRAAWQDIWRVCTGRED